VTTLGEIAHKLSVDELKEAKTILAFVERTKLHRAAGSLMELMTPIGKRFGDCTGEEVVELGERCNALGAMMEDAKKRP
jgi:hypothetical protein